MNFTITSVNLISSHLSWRYNDQTYPMKVPITPVPKPDAFAQPDSHDRTPGAMQKTEVVEY
jgi:hypothetical protein